MKITLWKSLGLLVVSAGLLLAQDDKASLAPLPQDNFVTLTQIASDFTTEPTAAVQKYTGARIIVYGRVGALGQSGDATGNPLVVYLQNASNPTPDVKAVFSPDDVPSGELQINSDQTEATIFHRDKEGNLTRQRPFVAVGQTVGIEGTFAKFDAGDIVLHNSRKVAKEKLQGLLQQHGIAE